MTIMTNDQLEKIIKGQNDILNKINQLSEIHTPDQYKYDTYPILNIKQAADLLNVSQNVIWEACINGELPCRKIGSTFIFLRDVLITWLNIDEPKAEVKCSIDSNEAAELLGVAVHKIRQWAKGYYYYKMPVIIKGSRIYFDKEQLLEWAKSPVFNMLKEAYLTNQSLRKQRLEAAEAHREAERLEKEAKKKNRNKDKQIISF